MLYFKEDAQFWLFWPCFICTGAGLASSTDCQDGNLELLNCFGMHYFTLKVEKYLVFLKLKCSNLGKTGKKQVSILRIFAKLAFQIFFFFLL